MELYKIAKLFRDKYNVSVVPVLVGKKKPVCKWKEYQKRLPTDIELQSMFNKSNIDGFMAVTGGGEEVNSLFCFDFDTKKETVAQDYWRRFCELVPKELKRKFYVNSTRNGGKHIWVRTTKVMKSSWLTRRMKTIPEIYEDYDTALDNRLSQNIDESLQESIDYVSEQLLKSPTETIIEYRSRGSYGVFYHPDYTHEYGKEIQWLTDEEMDFLLDVCYSLDCHFKKFEKRETTPSSYNSIEQFNLNTTAEDVVNMLLKTGMYKLVDSQRNKYRVLRLGSDSEHSGYVYKDTGILFLYSTNGILPEKKGISPFDLLMYLEKLSFNEAINYIKLQK